MDVLVFKEDIDYIEKETEQDNEWYNYIVYTIHKKDGTKIQWVSEYSFIL